jgi:hypothetical protein
MPWKWLDARTVGLELGAQMGKSLSTPSSSAVQLLMFIFGIYCNKFVKYGFFI